jgi:3-hydroxymyristoyl/3-hydroxydecanoyl-(acyl carrier protein) dehydratase
LSVFPVIESSSGDDGWSYVVQVPVDSRFFEGHFAARSVLPAIAQLELITRLQRLAVGERVSLQAIEVLRLLRPVGPGETLRVSLSRPDRDRRQRFMIRGTNDVVSRGTVTWAAGENR